VAVDAGGHILVAFAQGAAMNTFLVALIDGIVAQCAAFWDPLVRVGQQLVRVGVIKAAHFVSRVAVYANGCFAHTGVLCVGVHVILGYLKLVTVAAITGQAEFQGGTSPVGYLPGGMGIFANI
jgi:hypothetical protein